MILDKDGAVVELNRLLRKRKEIFLVRLNGGVNAAPCYSIYFYFDGEFAGAFMRDITSLVAKALGRKLNDKWNGLSVHGTGFDHAQDLTQEVSLAVFENRYDLKGVVL
jgi:hypothetical protein